MDETAITITSYDSEPSTVVNELAAALAALTPNVVIQRRERNSYSAWEWLLPAAVAVFVGKPLVEGFLGEIGASGARSVKDAIRTVIARTKPPKWVKGTEIKEMLRELKAAEREGRDASTEHIGRAGVILSLSLEIGTTTEAETTATAEFAFPHGTKDADVEIALGALPKMLAIANAALHERAKLDHEIARLRTEGSTEAFVIEVSPEYLRVQEQKIFAFFAERSWIDVRAEHIIEARKQIEARQKKVRKNRTSKRRR